jgi:hypothetical protein
MYEIDLEMLFETHIRITEKSYITSSLFYCFYFIEYK